MNPPPSTDMDRNALVEELSRLDACDPGDASISQAPSTVWGLKAELDTLIGQLREPAEPDPYASESGLRRAQELVLAIGVEPNTLRDRLESGRIGPYELLEKLGEGGMGVVYKAMHASLHKIVALKVLPPDRLNPQAISRFQREMKAVGKLDHPNIVRATDAGEVDGKHFLVMEYVDGIDLSKLLRSVGPLAAADACELARQAAVGLQHAHQRGLVHRDLKPSNIMLAWNEEHAPAVKILDLGLARLSEQPTPNHGDVTATGQMFGSLEYMSPEQSMDTHHVDIRSDIYSLGATLYKLICGNAPFSGERFNTPGKLVVALATETPPSLGERRSDLPIGLIAIVDRMLARMPAERPATPAEVARALAPFACGADLMRLFNRVRQQSPPPDKAADQLVTRKESHLSFPSSSIPPIPKPEAPEQELHKPEASAKESSGTPLPASNRQRLAFLALVALLGGSLLFGASIIRIVTNQGTIVIETDGSGIEVTLKDQQGHVLVDGETNRKITMSAGEYSIDVIVKDSDGEQRFVTDHFTLTRNGQKIVDARWEVAQPGAAADLRATDSTSTDPDHRAAEWVLSIGGNVRIKEAGAEREIRAVSDLPPAFELTFVSLNHNPMTTDAGLLNFKDCRNLTYLNLDGTQVSDAGLIHFRDCKDLTHLGLHDTQVTDATLALFSGCTDLTHLDIGGCALVSDAGLTSFKDCTHLTMLDLTGHQISDSGLANFKDCKDLTTLRVGGPNVTDAGLAYFKDCKNLTTLDLTGAQITDSGLAHFRNCKSIVGLHLNCAKVSEAGLLCFKDCRIGGLYLAGSQAKDAWLANFKEWKTSLGQLLLGGTQVTDAGLVHLQGFKHLGGLDLTRTRVSDVGLEHLASIQTLVTLELRGTGVTASGVAKLQASLPNCQIISDFPDADSDRRAAEYVLSIGGHINFNGIPQSTGAVGDLPRGAFELTGVILENSPQVNDAGLANFKDCRKLTSLHMHDAAISDAGLVYFKDCQNLTSLALSGKDVSDLGLAHFAGCRNLTSLDLAGRHLTDAGMAHFRECKQLTNLKLTWTNVSDRGLAYFTDCEHLTSLLLFEMPVTDAGLAHFQNCQKLKSLSLFSRQLSDAGLVHFRNCKNLELLQLSGMRAVSDEGLANFRNCKNLTVLDLQNSGVSDAGLANFQDCRNLTSLNLCDTEISDAGLEHLTNHSKLIHLAIMRARVTEPGVKKLSAALPGCRIEWETPVQN